MTQLITKCDYKFDKDKIIKEVLSISAEHSLYNGQLSLTHSKRTINSTTIEQLLEATRHQHQELNIFDMFNEQYKGTELHKIFNTIPNLGKFRIVMKPPMSCYNVHKDSTKKYHFVINTNPSSFFVFPERDEVIHIPCDGNVYLVDTLEPHTFINCGDSQRIHLVLSEFNDVPNTT